MNQHPGYHPAGLTAPPPPLHHLHSVGPPHPQQNPYSHMPPAHEPPSHSQPPKKRMRRLPPEKRQKVSSACNHCKRAKNKCNGLFPCDRCDKRSLECEYSGVDRRTLKGERKVRPRDESFDEGYGRPSLSPNEPPRLSSHQSAPAVTSVSSYNSGYSGQGPSPSDNSPFSAASNASTPASDPNGAATHTPSATTPKEQIPKSLQPLLTFDEDPVQSAPVAAPQSASEAMATTSEDPQVSNQQGKCAIWLADSEGTFRYISETCALSLLFDSRNLFRHFFGNSPYTDALKACPVLDKPYFNIDYKLPLPDRAQFNEYVGYFTTNINDAYFIFDDGYLTDVLAETVYANPYHLTYSKITLYLVAGLGSLFKDFEAGVNETPRSADLFRTGVKMWEEIQDFDDFWLIRLNYLAHFYYSALCKKSTSWMFLNTAIKHAQALGFHRSLAVEKQFSPDDVFYRKRLFRSLYNADKVLGAILGRPFAIADRDWDELPLIVSGSVKGNSLSEQSQLEMVKVTSIISRIVDNYYSGQVIDLVRTKKLALELKAWSVQLDERFDVSSLVKQPQLPNYSHVALLMHLLQLYATMLLARPFFFHELMNEFTGKPENKLAAQFQDAAVRAATLTVNLISYFNRVAPGANRFNETNLPTNACFFAAVVIGTQLLSQRMGPQKVQELSDTLKISMQVLTRYGATFKTAERYVEIMPYMAEHISRSKLPKDPVPSPADSTSLKWEFLDDLDFITDLNGDVSVLTEFQQGFVPSEFSTISLNGDNVSGSTCLPYDYPNYELFYGHKY
ncbi:filamentous growth regulator 27 [Diutina catenulata]